jgi:putative hydrolase of the HAD superfamily
MREAERDHWQLVDHELMSGTATTLVRNGFKCLQLPDDPQALQLTLDGYAQAISNWSIIFADSVPTLLELRKQGYQLALLSNTWWASEWHNADLASHGLDALLDVVVYSSDLPYSKPHPQAFHTVTALLGVQPERCVMVGDRLSADIKGGAGVGMRTVWKKTPYNWPEPDPAIPDATITNIAELLPLLHQWQGELRA